MELNQENQTTPSISFPEGTRSFSFQVAGHKHGQGKCKFGVVKHENGTIMKPLFEGDCRAVTELSFYETVFQNTDSDPLLNELQSFLPAFHGTWKTKIAEKDMTYLSIEDACEKFQTPSILDMKIGLVTYDEFCTKSKILEETSKCPYGNTLGIRIVGMKTYDEVNNTYITQEKMFLRKQKIEELPSVLGLYLSNNVQINIWLLCGFLHKLNQIDEWFSKQNKFKFVASSILFVYEGTLSSWSTWAQENHIPNTNELNSKIPNHLESDNSSKLPSTNHTSSNSEVYKTCSICGLYENICSKIVNSCPLYRVTMIDFAHCHPSTEIDTNYIFGLHNQISYFKLLLKSQKDILSA